MHIGMTDILSIAAHRPEPDTIAILSRITLALPRRVG